MHNNVKLLRFEPLPLRLASVPAACENVENPMADAILQGMHKAYAFGGIPEDCGEGYGCKSDYWGKWCRYAFALMMDVLQ